MSKPEMVVPILVCVLLSLNYNIHNVRSQGSEQSLYDFEITWTMNAPLDLNSENPLGSASFNFTITNTGQMPDQYTTEGGCSCGWPEVMSPQTIPFNDEAFIFPGESINFQDTVIVPNGTPPGHVCQSRMVVQSDYSRQKLTKEADIPLVLRSPYLSIHNISSNPILPVDGQDVTISAILANNGNFYEPRSNVSFFIDNESLALNISAGRMEPGETKNISIVWRALAGNHTIEARTENWFADDENRSQEIEILIKPAPTTNMPALSLFDVLPVILLLVLLVVVLVKRTKPYEKR